MLISKIPEVLDVCFHSNECLLIQGSHGIGKSEMVETFSRKNNIHNETLFLSTQEVGDLIGMPRTVKKDGNLIHTWTKPIWLQRMENAVMPSKMNFDDLEFTDDLFKDFVQKKMDNLKSQKVKKVCK